MSQYLASQFTEHYYYFVLGVFAVGALNPRAAFILILIAWTVIKQMGLI